VANMAGGVTAPILNPESVSRCDALYEFGRCHAADRRQRTIRHCSRRWLKHVTAPFAVNERDVIMG
jgi:hypothetical protein